MCFLLLRFISLLEVLAKPPWSVRYALFNLWSKFFSFYFPCRISFFLKRPIRETIRVLLKIGGHFVRSKVSRFVRILARYHARVWSYFVCLKMCSSNLVLWKKALTNLSLLIRLVSLWGTELQAFPTHDHRHGSVLFEKIYEACKQKARPRRKYEGKYVRRF